MDTICLTCSTLYYYTPSYKEKPSEGLKYLPLPAQSGFEVFMILTKIQRTIHSNSSSELLINLLIIWTKQIYRIKIRFSETVRFSCRKYDGFWSLYKLWSLKIQSITLLAEQRARRYQREVDEYLDYVRHGTWYLELVKLQGRRRSETIVSPSFFCGVIELWSTKISWIVSWVANICSSFFSFFLINAWEKMK